MIPQDSQGSDYSKFQDQLREISQPKSFYSLIVKADGSLGETHFFRALLEKLKGFFSFLGLRNMTDRCLVEYKVIEFLIEGKEWIKPEELDMVKSLASRVGLTSSHDQGLSSLGKRSHVELAKLVDALCQPDPPSLNELDGLAEEFYLKYADKLAPFSSHTSLKVQLVGNQLPSLLSSNKTHEKTVEAIQPLFQSKPVTLVNVETKKGQEEELHHQITPKTNPIETVEQAENPRPVLVVPIKNEEWGTAKKVVAVASVALLALAAGYGIWTYFQPNSNRQAAIPDSGITDRVYSNAKVLLNFAEHTWCEILPSAPSYGFTQALTNVTDIIIPPLKDSSSWGEAFSDPVNEALNSRLSNVANQASEHIVGSEPQEFGHPIVQTAYLAQHLVKGIFGCLAVGALSIGVCLYSKLGLKKDPQPIQSDLKVDEELALSLLRNYGDQAIFMISQELYEKQEFILAAATELWAFGERHRWSMTDHWKAICDMWKGMDENAIATLKQDPEFIQTFIFEFWPQENEMAIPYLESIFAAIGKHMGEQEVLAIAEKYGFEDLVIVLEKLAGKDEVLAFDKISILLEKYDIQILFQLSDDFFESLDNVESILKKHPQVLQNAKINLLCLKDLRWQEENFHWLCRVAEENSEILSFLTPAVKKAVEGKIDLSTSDEIETFVQDEEDIDELQRIFLQTEVVTIHSRGFEIEKKAEEVNWKDGESIFSFFNITMSAQYMQFLPLIDAELRDDEIFIEKLIYQCSYIILKYASPRLRNDPEFILKILKKRSGCVGNYYLLKYVTKNLKRNKDLFKKAYEYAGFNVLDNIDPTIKEDPTFFLELIELEELYARFANNVEIGKKASKALRTNEVFILNAMRIGGVKMLAIADDSLTKNADFMKLLILEYGFDAVAFSNVSLRGDLDFMLEAIEIIKKNNFKEAVKVVSSATDELRKNMLPFVDACGLKCLEYGSKSPGIQDIGAIVEKYGVTAVMQDLPNFFKSDFKSALAIVMDCGVKTLSHVAQELKDLEIFMTRVINKWGIEALDCETILREDGGFMRPIIGNNGLALKYLHPDLMRSSIFATFAVKNTYLALSFAGKWRNDTEIVLLALDQASVNEKTLQALELIGEDLLKDQDKVAKIAKKYHEVLTKVNLEWLSDVEWLSGIAKKNPEVLLHLAQEIADEVEFKMEEDWSNESFVSKAIARSKQKGQDMQEVFSHVDSSVKENLEVMESFAQVYGKEVLDYVPHKKRDRNFVKIMFDFDSSKALGCITPDFPLEQSLWDKYFEKSGLDTLNLTPEKWRNDSDFMGQAIEKWGIEALDCDSTLKEDGFFMRPIVKKNGLAIQYVEGKLKTNQAIRDEAIQQNPDAQVFIDAFNT